MRSRERGNQGRVHDASLEDEGKELEVPKCIVHSRETRRVHDVELKAEGRGFRALRCTNALKKANEGTWRQFEG